MITMKKYIGYASALMLGFAMVSCSSDIDTSERGSQAGYLTFNITEEGNNNSRATTSAAMKTSFEIGDKAGVFAVKNGVVMEEINNISLICNQYGEWEPETPIVYDKDQLQGVQFYAYYPYSKTATIDAAQTDPFGHMVSNYELTMQQGSKDSYEACDLMTTPAARVDEAALNTVKLSMRHRMAMVCVELPNASYVFPDQDIDTYVLSRATDEKFYLGGEEVMPFKDDATQQYRLIVKPATAEALSIGYTNNLGERDTFHTASLTNIKQGQCAKYTVAGGVNLKEWTLQVGDYYCADGNLLSKDATAEDITAKGDVIGIIFKIGTSTAVKQSGSNFTHAEVLALADYGKAAWGVSKSAGGSWGSWYTNFGMTSPSRSTINGQSTPRDTEANLQEVGLTYTQKWLSIPEDYTLDNVQQDYWSGMHKVYAEWSEANILPTGLATPWYVPSLREWLNIKSQTTILEAQIAKANGAKLWKDDFAWITKNDNKENVGYWSCTPRSEDITWQFTGLGTADHLEYDYVAGRASQVQQYYRFMFAF